MSPKKNPSIFQRLWAAFFKPARPVYMEDKASSKSKRRNKSSSGQSKAAHKSAKRAPEAPVAELSPEQPAYWGYMDAKGNVRLKGSERVLGKSNRSKKAALQDFAKRFADQNERAAELEALGPEAAHDPTQWRALERLSAEVKQQPGLGDLAALEGRILALEQSFSAAAQALHDQRLGLLDELATLAQLGKAQDVSTELEALEARWAAIAITGSVDEAPQLLRFERSAKAIRMLQSQVEMKKDDLAAEGDALAQALEDLVADSAWAEAEALLRKRAERRALIERAQGEALRKRLADLEAVIGANAVEQRKALEVERAAQDAERQAVLEEFQTYLQQEAWRQDPERARSIKQEWQALQADPRLSNPTQDLAFAQLSAALQDARQAQHAARAEQREEASHSRQGLLDALTAVTREAEAAPAAQGWGAFDAQMNEIRKAWDALKPAASKAEQQDLAQALEQLQGVRQAHFDRQAEARDQALEKKRILVDDVAKFSPALGSKELRQHLADSLEAWKAAGSAGRDHDEPLWQAYNAARDLVRAEIERLRQVEAGEAADRLAAAFAAKKERQAQIENLIMVDELLQESKPSKSLEKQIEKKRAQVRELQDQMMDIQRRLRDMSKRKVQEGSAAVAQGQDGKAQEGEQGAGDAPVLADKT